MERGTFLKIPCAIPGAIAITPLPKFVEAGIPAPKGMRDVGLARETHVYEIGWDSHVFGFDILAEHGNKFVRYHVDLRSALPEATQEQRENAIQLLEKAMRKDGFDWDDLVQLEPVEWR